MATLIYACALASISTGCGDASKGTEQLPVPAGFRSIGAGAGASPSFADALHAMPSRRRPPWSGFAIAGPSLSVTARHELARAVRMAIPLRVRARKDAFALVATSHVPGGPWTPLLADVSRDRRHLLFDAPRFSWFTPLLLDLRALFSEAKRQFDGLTAGATAEAPQPRCPDETGARADGWAIGSDGPDTIRWCFGRLPDGARILKVVNARRYPLSVHHPGAATIEAPSYGFFDLQRVSQKLAPNVTLLLPRAAVTYRLAGSARILTESDDLAQSLYQLQFGAGLAITFLTRFGYDKGTGLKKLAGVVADSTKCVNSLADRGNGGTLLASCFGDLKTLKDALGAKGVLLAAVMTVGATVEFFRSEIDDLGDTVDGRDRYAVRVDYTDPATQLIAADPDASYVVGPYKVSHVLDFEPRTPTSLTDVEDALGVRGACEAVHSGPTAQVRWPTLGVAASFTTLGSFSDESGRPLTGPASACDHRSQVQVDSMEVDTAGWHTREGLRIGDPVARIRQLYPSAQTMRDAYPDLPGTSADEWILHMVHSPFGGTDGTDVPDLVAVVAAGRVTALRVDIDGEGD
jgi:hypothetical protein